MSHKRCLIVTTWLITLAIGILAGCGNQETWSTYTNKNYGYSIEYPRGWSLSEPFQNRQMVVIKSTDEKETISVLVSESKGLNLDQQANFSTSAIRAGSYYYEIVSEESTKHQGIEAKELEVVFQSQKDSPRLNVKELYLIFKGQVYLVRFAISSADINSLQAIYQRVFSSFKLSK